MEKKILHIIDSLSRGGAENLLVSSVNSLEEYDHIIMCLHAPYDLKTEIKNAEIICLNITGRSKYINVCQAIRKIIKKHNVEIVHSHSYLTNILSRISTPRSIRLFNSYHFADYDTRTDFFIKRRMIFFDKLTYFKGLHIICVSDYVKNVLEKFCGYKVNITTIRNYISDHYYSQTDKAPPWNENEELRLISIGNLKKEKNYELLIQAFDSLKNFPVQLDVYGTGPELNYFTEKIITKGITNLHFKGASDHLHSVLPDYHAYVMSSYSEACPLSPLEAISAGLPMILSEIPSLKEIANENALFFENRNPDAFVQLIKSILHHEVKLRYDQDAYESILDRYSKSQYLTALRKQYEPAKRICQVQHPVQTPDIPGGIIYKDPFSLQTLIMHENGLMYKGKIRFPFIKGAIRVVSNINYTANFGFQWTKFRTTQIDTNLKNIAHSKERFFAATCWNNENLTNKNILEVGCGAGRFSQVVLAFTKANLFSVDYSDSVEANYENNKTYGDRFKLFQASIYEMPFEGEQFEKVFCFGVLQHTPDVKKSVRCLAEMVKPGGELIVDFYPITGWWTKIHAKYLFRYFTKKMDHEKLLNKIEKNVDWMIGLSNFFNRIGVGKLFNRFVPICDFTSTFPADLTRQQMREWCVLDTFDMFSPQYDQPQRISSIKALFEQLGFTDIFADFITYGNNNHGVIVKGFLKP